MQPHTTAESRGFLSLRGVEKRFGGVQALKGVDFEVRPGEVHAVLGANGAGKSTLIKIMSGAETPDAGEIRLNGNLVNITSTRQAFDNGIATVYQEPHVFPELTVVENVFLGRELRDRWSNVDWGCQRQRVRELFESLSVDPRITDEPVFQLSVALRQMVLIAKALAHEARMIIFDEPSAILTQRETDTLFQVIRRLKAQGVAIIYISHRLEEVFTIADRVTIMKDGAVVVTKPSGELSENEIVELMAGRALLAGGTRERRLGDETALQVRGLSQPGRFEGVDFDVRRGEIVGFFGLIGSGGNDIGLALFGVEPATAGEIRLEGRRAVIRSPKDASDHGIALLPEDRKTQGIFEPLPVAYNLSIGNLGLLSRARLLIDSRREDRLVDGTMQRLAIKAPTSRTPIANLSGGNQQKVLLGRQLARQPRVLILDEPTRGVDVSAKEEIHNRIFELAEVGVAVIVISSELLEVMKLSDRLVVMRAGRVSQIFERGSAESVQVLNAAIGEEAAAHGGR